jgi:hypothetical protein
VSPRTVFHDIQKYEKERTKNKSTYWVVFELTWRDFYRFFALKHGDLIFKLEGVSGQRRAWSDDRELFSRWRDGRTGWPLVDANMRELKATGAQGLMFWVLVPTLGLGLWGAQGGCRHAGSTWPRRKGLEFGMLVGAGAIGKARSWGFPLLQRRRRASVDEPPAALRVRGLRCCPSLCLQVLTRPVRLAC